MDSQRRFAALLLGITGLLALSLFFLNGYYACMFTSGRKNCLFDALATLSLFLLALIFGWRALVVRDPDTKAELILMCFFISAWAGMGLAENLVVLWVALNLFGYVLYRWFKKNGIRWSFFRMPPDDKDDSR